MAASVSVIIPAYNAAAYVGRAIESALAQTEKPLEVLVIDDGSGDHTGPVVRAYEPAVRLISKPNGGPATARNLGARLARGEWLALLDADDWWQPEKLAVQLALATEPDIGLIHCLPDHRTDRVPAVLGFDDLWVRNWIVNSSVLLRRDVFEALGGFDKSPELISVEDYNLWLRLAASKWRIVTCQRTLMHYTRGIGISANSARFMRASLHNLDSLERRLRLPPAMVQRRRIEIVFQFARQALYERDLATARMLFRRAFAGRRSLRIGLNLAAAWLPEPVLGLKRRFAGVLQPRRAGTPSSAPGAAWPARPPASAGRSDVHGTLAALDQPLLVTTIDAEEDFDWSRPFSSHSSAVTSMRSQHRAHRVFERFGVVPTYMVDYPVASQPQGRDPLRELLQDGCCDIGAQLHPWVTPPLVEQISARNSFQRNLPPEVEFAKMRVLTVEIENAFGCRPRIFRAGRYGIGGHTAGILRELGYQADSSVVPYYNFRRGDGPDFRHFSAMPHWIDPARSLLELPISAAVVGRAAGAPHALSAAAFGRFSERGHIPWMLARLGLLERIKLTPEGITIDEAKRLVRHMHAVGHRVFVLTYHSPSLEAGNTPYVRNAGDLDRFLAWIEEFLDFFTTEMNGRSSNWSEVRELLRAS